MSYDIRFKAKLQDCDFWVDVGDCDANITWNVRNIITKSTGLDWLNGEDNGLLSDVILNIYKGLKELQFNGESYRNLESPNGWGTVKGTIGFFQDIIDSWEGLVEDYPEVAKVAHFFIC